MFGLKWFALKDVMVESLSKESCKKPMTMLCRKLHGMTEDSETQKFISQYWILLV